MNWKKDLKSKLLVGSFLIKEVAFLVGDIEGNACPPGGGGVGRATISTKIKYQTLAEAPDEYILAYYEHQYERMEKLEGQSLIVTNIVITLSVLAFSFGLGNADEVIGVLVGLALLFCTILSLLVVTNTANDK